MILLMQLTLGPGLPRAYSFQDSRKSWSTAGRSKSNTVRRACSTVPLGALIARYVITVWSGSTITAPGSGSALDRWARQALLFLISYLLQPQLICIYDRINSVAFYIFLESLTMH